ncbi:unnamed protein product [Linum trigynum]|uniref:Uncharacterized protein n=1 Tax=Linum trigynum TaxID=586398 RepID=A0AAV2CT68_9ROSI
MKSYNAPFQAGCSPRQQRRARRGIPLVSITGWGNDWGRLLRWPPIEKYSSTIQRTRAASRMARNGKLSLLAARVSEHNSFLSVARVSEQKSLF